MKYKYSVNENYFSKINNHEKAYILGFISADGGVYENNLTIGQSGKYGKIILEWIREKMNSNNVIVDHKPKKDTHNVHYKLHINSKKIVKDLKKYNIIENKKYNYDFPKILNTKFFKSFLRGYFDGDGCVGIYNEKSYSNGGNINYSEYLKLSFYGTKIFINNSNERIPLKLRGRVLTSKSGIHAEIIWTNKKAREFGKWLFVDNPTIFSYIKIKKFINYIDNYQLKPKLHARLSKAVLQKNLQGKIIGEFSSISEVKRKLKISIGNCLTGITKQAGGYLWSYKK